MIRTFENDQAPPDPPGWLRAMMKIIAGLILLLVPLSSIAEECEISGKAILWAYDSCFWQHETDDAIHPGVLDCVDEGQQVMLAQRVQLDILDQDHFIVVRVENGIIDNLLDRLAVAARQVLHRTRSPVRRILQAIPGGILAHSPDDGLVEFFKL